MVARLLGARTRIALVRASVTNELLAVLTALRCRRKSLPAEIGSERTEGIYTRLSCNFATGEPGMHYLYRIAQVMKECVGQ